MEELRYRQYVTEALRLLTENTTHFVVPGYGEVSYGNYIQRPWFDVAAKSRSSRKEDNRTGDEVAAEVIRRIGLKLKEDGEN